MAATKKPKTRTERLQILLTPQECSEIEIYLTENNIEKGKVSTWVRSLIHRELSISA